MAYTYEDFYKKATDSGMLGQFKEDELKIAQQSPEYGLAGLKLRQDMAKAQSPEEKLLAQETLNQVKKSYAVPQLPNYGKEFTWSGPNQQKYQELLNKVTSREPFSYDPDQDPNFQAYKKTYAREGDRAVNNVLARTSQMTGGVPSSYAVSAAGQAGNVYAAKTADIIPSLYKDAYYRNNQDLQADMGILGALGSDRDFDYRNYYQSQQQQYQKWLQDYQIKMQEDALKYQRALQAYQLGERSPEIAEILGITYKDPAASQGGGGWSLNSYLKAMNNSKKKKDDGNTGGPVYVPYVPSTPSYVNRLKK